MITLQLILLLISSFLGLFALACTNSSCTEYTADDDDSTPLAAPSPPQPHPPTPIMQPCKECLPIQIAVGFGGALLVMFALAFVAILHRRKRLALLQAQQRAPPTWTDESETTAFPPIETIDFELALGHPFSPGSVAMGHPVVHPSSSEGEPQTTEPGPLVEGTIMATWPDSQSDQIC